MSTPQATIITALADRLAAAARDGRPCSPVRAIIGAENIQAAYQVQSEVIAARVASGSIRVGRKIGLTSVAVQTQLGVDQPDFGVLLDDMAVPAGGVAPMSRVLQPRVEGEIAFRLATDLDGLITPDRVRAAVAAAYASIEIVDSRIEGWDIRIADTIADNASSGLFVVAESGRSLADFEPVEAMMSLRVNGELRSEGTGAACLGDPLSALAWLARVAADYGDPLRSGDLVLSGALGPVVPVVAGDHVDVEISGLGVVSVDFGGSKA